MIEDEEDTPHPNYTRPPNPPMERSSGPFRKYFTPILCDILFNPHLQVHHTPNYTPPDRPAKFRYKTMQKHPTTHFKLVHPNTATRQEVRWQPLDRGTKCGIKYEIVINPGANIWYIWYQSLF